MALTHTLVRLAMCLMVMVLFRGGETLAAEAPPNVVVILVDDLGWMDLSCQGSGYYRTPNIDRLASRGVRFTDAYAACAVCSPTRAAVLTGRYPSRIGVTDWIRPEIWASNRPPSIPGLPGFAGTGSDRLACPETLNELPLEEVTLAEALRGTGYATCHIGKWHLGDEGHYPTDQGFERNVGGCGIGAPHSYFDPYSNRRQPQGIPTLAPRREGEYLTDREADEAVAFIREHRGGPFFLYLAHHAVHTPIQGKPDLIAEYEHRPRTNQSDATYAAMVQSMDESVGRVMGALEELGLDERTLVIFTSDNGGLDGLSGERAGWPTDNAPLRWGKGHPYEGGVRVPMIVRWPGVSRPGVVTHEPAISMDVFATALDAAGVAAPSGRVIDGVSLRPALSGEGDMAPRPLFWHFPHYGGDDRVPYSIVRDGEWKLIRYYDPPREELYHLTEDTGEERNLSAVRPEIAQRLSRRLDGWLRESGSRMPRPNPIYRADP